MRDTPQTQEVKKTLLATALAQVNKVSKAAENSTSTNSETTQAAALLQLGRLYKQLGKSDDAMRLFSQVHEIMRRRVELKNRSDATRKNLAAIVVTLAEMDLEFKRDLNSSLARNREALALFEEIQRDPRVDEKGLGGVQSHEVLGGLAEMNSRVGVTCLRLGRIAEAAENFRRSLDFYRERLAFGEQYPAAINKDVKPELVV